MKQSVSAPRGAESCGGESSSVSLGGGGRRRFTANTVTFGAPLGRPCGGERACVSGGESSSAVASRSSGTPMADAR
eukprot:5419388-Pyramimonas_sp.AAC.1